MRLPVLSFLSLLPLLLSRTVPTQAYTPLSDALLRDLPSPSEADFDPRGDGDPEGDGGKNRSLLAPLLIPRVPGTPGQARAQEHLARFFADALPEWELLWQNSTARTPATGDRDVPFQNLILRREPPWLKGRGRGRRRKGGGGGKKKGKEEEKEEGEEKIRAQAQAQAQAHEGQGRAALLTLVAHYDSKREPEGFVGATDSAAPCAMLMYVAREIEKYLARMWAAGGGGGGGGDDDGEGGGPGEDDVGVQILFLDGEEAFVKWTEEDSLYGSR